MRRLRQFHKINDENIVRTILQHTQQIFWFKALETGLYNGYVPTKFCVRARDRVRSAIASLLQTANYLRRLVRNW